MGGIYKVRARTNPEDPRRATIEETGTLPDENCALRKNTRRAAEKIYCKARAYNGARDTVIVDISVIL